ncbi:MAG: hypothetical protein KF812_11240 [Fimbriimonadaceae bacterium]|nr:hypothetical protein [Fimbriimonadaceae bacterium]
MSESNNPNEYRGVRNDLFDKGDFVRGKPFLVEVVWYFVKMGFFLSAFPWPSRLKATLLRLFGAKVGAGLYIRPRVNIHMPWKLVIGDHVWIGERCELLNLEQLELEDHVSLGHDVFLAAASHNIRSRTMAYANKPILIKRGTWVASRTFVGAGVTVGENCVIGAGAAVVRDVPDNSIVVPSPSTILKERVLSDP